MKNPEVLLLARYNCTCNARKMVPWLQDTDRQAFFKVLAIKNLYMRLSLDTFCVKAQCTL